MIGLLSDSHDNLDAVRAIVTLFNDAGCRLVLHAGDVVAPFTARALAALRCPVRAVFGNVDGEKDGLRKAFAETGSSVAPAPIRIVHEGLRIVLVHLDADAARLAASGGADVFVFGHTHKPEVRRLTDGALLVNPGEAGGWLYGKKTVGLLDPKTREVEIVEVR